MKEDARNMDDRPDRFELFTLVEGEEKVTMEWDSRVPNTAIFTFNREDHTLGNLLTSALLETEHVLFAAYKVPHPLFPLFRLRVSTDAAGPGPKAALTAACKRTIEDLSSLSKKLTREWELAKLAAAKDGRPDLAAERGQWVEREQRLMREQHARWDRERARERRAEMEAERRRVREAEREQQKEIEALRAKNEAARDAWRAQGRAAARVPGDPVLVGAEASPESADEGVAPSAPGSPAPWGAEEPRVAAWGRRPAQPAARPASPSPAPWGAEEPQVAAWGRRDPPIAAAAPPAARPASPSPAPWGAEEPQVAAWGRREPPIAAAAPPIARPASPSPAPWGAEEPQVAAWGRRDPPIAAAAPPATRPASPSPAPWGAEEPQVAAWGRPPAQPAARPASPSPAPWGAEEPQVAAWSRRDPPPAAAAPPVARPASPSPAPWGAEEPQVAPWSRLHPPIPDATTTTTTTAASQAPAAAEERAGSPVYQFASWGEPHQQTQYALARSPPAGPSRWDRRPGGQAPGEQGGDGREGAGAGEGA